VRKEPNKPTEDTIKIKDRRRTETKKERKRETNERRNSKKNDREK
jgi:hypothetical protein